MSDGGGYRSASRPRGDIPVDVVECRACHARVQFSSTGRCPACRTHFHDAEDDGRRQIRLKANTVLPEICAECGQVTERRVVVKRARPLEEDTGRKAMRLYAGGIFGLLFGWLVRTADHFVVELPLCRECPTPEPHHVDFVDRVMVFHVHRELHDAHTISQT